MRASRALILTMLTAALLLLPACAASPEAVARQQAIEADIEEILSVPLDPAEYGATKRCLSDHEYRNFRVLDERRILFEGRRDKLWLNTLRMRCADLRYAYSLQVRTYAWGRICDTDQFLAADWFYWPWYRRWPWHWGSWETSVPCTLGKFQPVTEAQVAEIEAVLRRR